MNRKGTPKASAAQSRQAIRISKRAQTRARVKIKEGAAAVRAGNQDLAKAQKVERRYRTSLSNARVREKKCPPPRRRK